MRISDWSSDVCSSDLPFPARTVCATAAPAFVRRPQHLADEGLRLPAFCPSVAGPSRPDLVLVVGAAHRRLDPSAQTPARRGTIAISTVSREQYARPHSETSDKSHTQQNPSTNTHTPILF